ncbi:hypothetical protein EV368DRAFT_43923 [Lentinula lateritia]|uniref:Uncharacterized protein n=1 Tax=Lentinula aff. lateritia TaxID=2804960 RepID=A0ACC1UEK6_9AGAR|nr:hypothetical protein F5876DRAFT_31298 [Lentinula aff. lateritia]KAJ3851079.1 hypothetical protein EV368DRAFT_43923 [Lentinula lateritia]
MLNFSKSSPPPYTSNPYRTSRLPSPAISRRPSPSYLPLAILRSSKSLLTKRYFRVLFLVIFSTTFLFLFLRLTSAPSFEPLQQKGLPPLFEAWKEYERTLPQHAEDDGAIKFIYMKNHVFASGWGNALQEMILNTHLAYLSGRSFVFDNYTWDRSPSEYSTFNGKTILSRVPVSTMLAGPMIGGSFDPSYFVDPLFTIDPSSQSHPRAVSSEFYERVCAGKKKIVDSAVVRDAVANWDGKANLEAWVKHLKSLPNRCVEIDVKSEHIFNIWMFGSPKILTLWPSLSQSPILRQFTHSPLILGAFERHRHLFGESRTPLSSISNSPSNSSLPLIDLDQLPQLYPHSPATPNINNTIPGLVVLHIRRGDFEQHCINLVEWGAAFNGFNSFEDIWEQDGFDSAAAGAGTPKYDTAKTNYLERCFPEIGQIVRRVRQVREAASLASLKSDTQSAPLTHLYVMTNGRPPFLAELRAALELDAIANNPLDLPPWESIYTSRDLELGWEEAYVSQALDMYVAQRAEVFVGNGFSSLTSNILMLRKANGVDSIKTRLW